MIINHRKKFIFYHVPKAAGSSIRSALLNVAGSYRPRRQGTKHLTPEEFKNSWNWLQEWRLRNYFTFCFVRNPWERFGSAHRYILSRGLGELPNDVNEAAKLLADRDDRLAGFRSFRPQINYANGLSFVGKFESMEEDYGEICRRFNVAPNLPHLNSSGSEVIYSRNFTSRTIDILSQFYRENAEAFGYMPPLN